MFATVEKYSGPAKIMLGLIALTFVGFGAGGIIATGSDYIVKVGGEKISTQNVQEAQREQNLGSGQDALAYLTERAYLAEGAKMMGIGVSEAQLKQVIVDDPGFHDENGRFSEAKFRLFLQQGGLTEERFLENLRNSFALQNLVNLAGGGNIVSSAQAEQYAALMLADREIRSIALDPKTFAAQIKADDAALKAYYDKDKSKYRLPQAVKYQYIELSPRTLAESQKVGEDELKKAFEEQQKNAAPTREVAHIMLKTEGDAAKTKAEAEKILAEAKAAPEKFAELAAKYSQDAGTAQTGGSLATLEGVVKRLDGSFQLLEHAKPIVQKVIRQRLSPQQLWRRSRTQSRMLGQMLGDLPKNLLRLNRNLQSGRLNVNLDLKRLDSLNRHLEYSANRLTMGMVTAALIIGSSILLSSNIGPKLFGLSFVGFLGYLLAFANSLWIIWSIWRSGKH